MKAHEWQRVASTFFFKVMSSYGWRNSFSLIEIVESDWRLFIFSWIQFWLIGKNKIKGQNNAICEIVTYLFSIFFKFFWIYNKMNLNQTRWFQKSLAEIDNHLLKTPVAMPPIYLHWDFWNFWYSPVWNIQFDELGFFPSLKTNWIFLPVQTGVFSKFLG